MKVIVAKFLILITGILLPPFAYAQDPFTITENGLTPSFATTNISHFTSDELYQTTLNWIEDNEEQYKLSIDELMDNRMIQFTSVKWNAVNLGDQYYIAEYGIRLSFEEEQYTFEPLTIRLKLNSKYDLGWEEFDLTNGSPYYKKGKVIKKYKTYLGNLVAQLNEISLSLAGRINMN